MTDDREPEPTDDEQPAPPSQTTVAPSGPGIPWRLGLFLVLAVLVVVFAVQNTQDAELHFLGWSWRLPLVIIILVAVVVSIILDEVLGGIVKRRRARRRLEREELRRLRGEG